MKQCRRYFKMTNEKDYLNYCSGCVQHCFKKISSVINNSKTISKNHPELNIGIYEKIAEVKNGELIQINQR